MGKEILDWNKYIEKAVEVVAEGIVMLKNDNNALPLSKNAEIAIFGRTQLHYYKSGVGSGGLVNVSKVTGITDGLLEIGCAVNQKLLNVYKKWDEENPIEIGAGWGTEPWSQKEMLVPDDVAAEDARACEKAIVVIGRTAGEDQDNKPDKGSYLLTDEEEKMLETVRKHFKKVVVLLNVGNIIDMSFVKKYNPDSVLYVWQGGMTGGTGVADVLVGKVSPSGKLSDTIAENINDYPSHENFGSKERNFYCEDIYVGYRYFETFAKEKVLYPFGFGMSYTSFDISVSKTKETENSVMLTSIVKNTGSLAGKEVVQVYFEAPQGKLGKPVRSLCAFEKTQFLEAGQSEGIGFSIDKSALASYDDCGKTGYPHCFVLEKGEYSFYLGTDVRSAKKVFTFTQNETVCVKKCTQALAPVLDFNRMIPVADGDKLSIAYEAVTKQKELEETRRQANLPKEIAYTGDKGIKLADVLSGKNTMDEFIAQLSDYDLSCIIRGEGMGSPKVTPGTAAAFGGVTDNLVGFGIPCACCSDGPSGMRLDCGTKAFSLPNGTLIASTFNKRLITELFAYLGKEMSANKVECLLGPGINIHRYPLNGRNFEYLSEDPYLTGELAAAELKGLHSADVTGTIKHFCGNNQEAGRHISDSVISERALREIYLKPFEIAIKDGKAESIMTTYGSVNGLWTAGSYDLTTTILRDDWHFDGIAMTDWWASINRRNMPQCGNDFAQMAETQNDLYMVCRNSAENDDNTLDELEKGNLSRGELQRNAANICRFLMHTNAMKRLQGIDTVVKIENRDEDGEGESNTDLATYKIDSELTISPDDITTTKGSNYSMVLDVSLLGSYRITVTASSNSGELAQLPLTIFCIGTPCGTMTWNGTNGKEVALSCNVKFYSRFVALRMYFGQSGLKIHSIKFERTGDI